MILVTGGAGFIGSNFVRQGIQRGKKIAILDALTYAGNLHNLEGVSLEPNYKFFHGSIGDQKLVERILREVRPSFVVNFAAESHVDRSILGPKAFIDTNITGTFLLLESVKKYWEELAEPTQSEFRFLHVSTDEVYGTLAPEDPPFTELNPYTPNSPYSASKAASDHLVRAYFQTYGLPVLTTNCSNNYGPNQFPEKLIPRVIVNALNDQPLPIYGDGLQIRDWLFVEDHCEAIWQVLDRGQVGEVFNIGGNSELPNIDLVKIVCRTLDKLMPRPTGAYEKLISFVADRPGHDRRYSVDISKIKNDIQWTPKTDFESGIIKTVGWYLANQDWVEQILDGSYRQSISE